MAHGRALRHAIDAISDCHIIHSTHICFYTMSMVHSTYVVVVVCCLLCSSYSVVLQGEGDFAALGQYPRDDPSFIGNASVNVAGFATHMVNQTVWCWTPELLASIQARRRDAGASIDDNDSGGLAAWAIGLIVAGALYVFAWTASNCA